ncbi:hypothetical protein D3C71_1584480 [compost metagenome]
MAASTKAVAATASSISDAPAQAPMAAEPHKVAAVFRPRMLPPSRMIAPAPRNPTPDTT